MPLYEKASCAYAADRFADAAEYARHALSEGAAGPLRAELSCLRGESLLRSGQPEPAARAFQAVASDLPVSPYVPQALFGLVQSRRQSGDLAGAEEARARLLREYGESPWARRLSATGGGR